MSSSGSGRGRRGRRAVVIVIESSGSSIPSDSVQAQEGYGREGIFGCRVI